MIKEFAGASYTLGQLNAIIKLLKKQAGEDGPELFLRGEICVSEPARPVEAVPVEGVRDRFWSWHRCSRISANSSVEVIAFAMFDTTMTVLGGFSTFCDMSASEQEQVLQQMVSTATDCIVHLNIK